MSVGIVGGGLMGLALAWRLGRQGHRVRVFERAEQVGGLATWHDFGPCTWDRFYHVILPSDSQLIGFLNELGLGGALRWRTTQTGFFVDRRFHPLNHALDFLGFPPLSLWSKLRLAWTILYCARIDDWRRLEKVCVEDFLLRHSGRATYEKLWKPLLLAKLGENYRRVSAVFIWTYVKRMFTARDSGAGGKEQLGHVAGGYRTVFATLLQAIGRQGGEVQTGVSVERVARAPGGRGVTIQVDGRQHRFDKVIFTGPVNVLQQVTAPDLVEVQTGERSVEYLGVVCGVCLTRRPLMPYYILNIADDRIPFTGVIGMSNIVSTEETSGLHVTYLPKYVASEDPILRSPEAELREMFLDGLQMLFPEFDAAGMEALHVNRAVKVQPLQVLDYSSLVPRTTTLHQDFYVLNTAQFVNNTLNNNEVIRAVNGFFTNLGHHFGVAAPAAAAPSPRRAAAAAG